MAKYKNNCKYFYACFFFIARSFFINKLKNIFNTTLSKILQNNKKHNQKTTFKIFKDKQDWMTDRLIEMISEYAQLWIASIKAIDYSMKYLYAK